MDTGEGLFWRLNKILSDRVFIVVGKASPEIMTT